MKKFIAIFLTVAVMCAAFATVAFAADGELTIAVNVSDYVIGGGKDTITVEVSFVNNPGLDAARIFLDYPDWATPDSIAWGPCAPSSRMWNKNSKPLQFMASGAGTYPELDIYETIREDGVFATITFKVDESAIDPNGDNSFTINAKTEITGDYYAGAGKLKYAPVEKGKDGDGSVKLDCVNHVWGAWTDVEGKKADCENDGEQARSCTKCGTTETKSVSALGHSSDNKLHYVDGGSTHWNECVRCHNKMNEADHKGGTPTCVAAAVCDDCGASYGGAGGTDPDSPYHHYDEGKVTKEPTCGEEGELLKTCPDCGTIKTEKISNEGIDHTWGDWEVVDKAECEKKGSEKRVCSVCKTDETREIEELGHDYEGVVTKEPTCTNKGVKTFTCKNDSDHTYTEEIDELHHLWSDWADDGDGNHSRSCTREDCDGVNNKETKEHDIVANHDDKNHWNECSDCDYKADEEEHKGDGTIDGSNAKGHWDNCTTCGYQITDPHTNKVPKPAVDPTPTADGCVAHWYCPDCNKYFFADGDNVVGDPHDNEDPFVVKYNVGCNGRHRLVGVPMDGNMHLLICLNKCGFVLPIPHNFALDGTCIDCGYHIVFDSEGGFEDVDVETPTQGIGGDEDPEDIGVTDPEPELAVPEQNPHTGVALSLLPAMIAAAAMIVRKH